MPRWIAVLVALFATFLWSTSYILNKWAFAEGIGPMTLAGLRYGIAALTLGIVRVGGHRRARTPSTLGPWRYIGLGLAGYVVAQGFQYVGQYRVTPTQASLALSVGNTLLVLLTGYVWLKERPGLRQALGLLLALGGAGLYLYPWNLAGGSLLGIGMILLSGVGYAIQLTANRAILGRNAASPLDLVLYPMIVGAACMAAYGLWQEPWPGLNGQLVAILLWLGSVNGALAFFLWTYSQKALQAFESSVLNNSMLLQIALLDALLLNQAVTPLALGALVTAGLGILAVQLAKDR